MSMLNKIYQGARFISYILSNEHVEQDWPSNKIYFIYIIQWACWTRLTKEQDLYHIYYPMSMLNKIDQETRFISYILSNEHVEQDWPSNKIYIINFIQWTCGTRLTKKHDLFHLYYPMSMWKKIDQETRFISYLLSNEHAEQDWPRNKIYIIYIIQWAFGTRMTKEQNLLMIKIHQETVTKEQDWRRD